MCHVSCVMCNVSPVTCHRYLKKLQIGELCQWRVCYQRSLPRLVYIQLGKGKQRWHCCIWAFSCIFRRILFKIPKYQKVSKGGIAAYGLFLVFLVEYFSKYQCKYCPNYLASQNPTSDQTPHTPRFLEKKSFLQKVTQEKWQNKAHVGKISFWGL